MNDIHEKPLFALQEEGRIESKPETFKRLIHPAALYCRNCGRSAADRKNLCSPEAL